jgi:glycosyltransferase involved in cell wall biosynthesis
MSNFVVLCPLEGMEQMAQSQWTKSLVKLGHRVKNFNLRSKGVDPRANLPRLLQKICEFKPEAIFVEGILGFNLPEFYLSPEIQNIPVASFWFDDPYRSLKHRQNEKDFFELLRLKNFYHFVWDGYWRRWLNENHQIRSFPIHLAADPDEFFPLRKNDAFNDSIIFVGTLISPAKIHALKSQLPPALDHIADAFDQEYKRSIYGSSPYYILEQTISSLPIKWAKAYEMFAAQNPEMVGLLNAYVWMIGKNETRIRILKAALSVGPLLILSANLEGTHATKAEINALLENRTTHLEYRDSSGYEKSLAEVYAFGKIHIQATDPQSIDGGIPFRVFQTTACHRPLLTDQKTELKECFKYGREILTFESDKDFVDKLRGALRNPSFLEEVAEQGYKRFLKEHTWKKRMEQVLQTLKANGAQ